MRSGQCIVDRNDNGGADQNAVLLFFGDHQGTFLNPETLAEPGRHNDGATFANFGGLQWFLLLSECLIISKA